MQRAARVDLVRAAGEPALRRAQPVGLEVAGEVVAVGAGVDRYQVGDKVCALTNGGGYA